MARYFTAVVKCRFQTYLKFHNITQVRRFVDHVEQTYQFIVIFFYEGKDIEPNGNFYSGWYTTKAGLRPHSFGSGKRGKRMGVPDRSAYWALVNSGKLPHPKSIK